MKALDIDSGQILINYLVIEGLNALFSSDPSKNYVLQLHA